MAKDRGDYSAIYRSLCDSDEWESLSLNARIVFLAGLKLSSENNIVGVFRQSHDLISVRTAVPLAAVGAALDELERENWIVRDGGPGGPGGSGGSGWIWIRNHLRFDPTFAPGNEKQLKGVFSVLDGLPRIRLVAAFVRYYQGIGYLPEDLGAWVPHRYERGKEPIPDPEAGRRITAGTKELLARFPVASYPLYRLSDTPSKRSQQGTGTGTPTGTGTGTPTGSLTSTDPIGYATSSAGSADGTAGSPPPGLVAARDALNRELDVAVAVIEKPRDLLLALHSRTPTGAVITSVSKCTSVPWIEATTSRVLGARLIAEAELRPEKPPPPPRDRTRETLEGWLARSEGSRGQADVPGRLLQAGEGAPGLRDGGTRGDLLGDPRATDTGAVGVRGADEPRERRGQETPDDGRAAGARAEPDRAAVDDAGAAIANARVDPGRPRERASHGRGREGDGAAVHRGAPARACAAEPAPDDS